jgi:hypothetical protein
MAKLPQLLKAKPVTDEQRLAEYVHDLSAEKLRKLLSGKNGERNRRIIDAALAKIARYQDD